MDMGLLRLGRRPGTAFFRTLVLAAAVLSFTGYMSLDFDHPPSHTHGGNSDCDCPGDWAPAPGLLPSVSVSRAPAASPIEFVIPEISLVPASITGPAWWDDQLHVPRVLLDSLPVPALLI